MYIIINLMSTIIISIESMKTISRLFGLLGAIQPFLQLFFFIKTFTFTRRSINIIIKVKK